MYTYREFYIPERMMGGLDRWIQHGIKPGDFLTAVLENNLRATFERADDKNSQNVPAYLAYLYNECPADSWGSKEKVAAWQEKKLSERAALVPAV